MTSFPNFSAHGYHVIKELGHNLEGGRFTYLAKRLTDNVDVAIKQFQFATGSGWDGFRAIEREIKSLQGLNHRGIPKYLDKFETDNGYCLVTEYFPADTLAVGRSFTPDQIKQIAVQLLEILVYLQERIPPVIHRDVKPENILVDDNLNVYLIDFGFARVGSGSVAMSSANAGTFGFMAPEQIRNLKLTNASDLYGLGLTLICLIGAIRSTDIGNYIDFSNQLDRSRIEPKLKGCSLTFVKWLDRMVAPDPSKRFTDAKTALKGLQPLYVTRYPSVEISKSSLEFKATSLGEKLTQTITLSNSTPETVLEGRWEVEPHPNDPPHTPDSHAWISFSPKQFKGNKRECQITVDTSKLIAQKSGKRHILLRTNAVSEVYTLPISIVTAPLPAIKSKKIPYLTCTLFLATSVPFGYFIALSIASVQWIFGNLSSAWSWAIAWILTTISASIGGCIFTSVVSFVLFIVVSIIGVLLSPFLPAFSDKVLGMLDEKNHIERNPVYLSAIELLYFIGMSGIAFGVSSDLARSEILPLRGVINSWALFYSVVSFLIWLSLACGAGMSWLSYLKIPKSERYSDWFFDLICLFWISLGSCWQTGLLSNPYLIYMFTKNLLSPISYILLVTTMILGSLVILTVAFTFLISPIQRHQKIAAYRRKEEHLIKP
jgi:serine/threonine protein kinase